MRLRILIGVSALVVALLLTSGGLGLLTPEPPAQEPDLLTAPGPVLQPSPTPATIATPPPATTPEAMATLAPEAALTEAQARQVVSEYFQAIDNEDFNTLLSLTTGQAENVTQEFIAQVQQLEQQYGVEAQLNVTRQVILGVEQADTAWVVSTESTIETAGGTGLAPVPGPTYAGPATFTVEPVNGQPRITTLDLQLQQQ